MSIEESLIKMLNEKELKEKYEYIGNYEYTNYGFNFIVEMKFKPYVNQTTFANGYIQGNRVYVTKANLENARFLLSKLIK
ncbi:hypothetical protein [Clostridium tarantellae]|uniref:Uncharacterized protein n=1 Tax=Clostridium tarantellae TaxID=39493 RepID=A0A6I1MN70_9CLOT|nr:hypothetical protein [Clostridium tarantellae]MPQ44845.1 hypothetical protein [Clostridium tarantellae]